MSATRPYEGRQIKGWPITVVSRGRVVVEDGKLNAARGSGQFLPCASPDSSKPQGKTAPELQAMSGSGEALVLRCACAHGV